MAGNRAVGNDGAQLQLGSMASALDRCPTIGKLRGTCAVSGLVGTCVWGGYVPFIWA